MSIMFTTTNKIKRLIKQYNNNHNRDKSTLVNPLNEKMNYFIKFFNNNKSALVDTIAAYRLLKQFKFDNPDSDLDPSKIYSNCGIYKCIESGERLFCVIENKSTCSVKLNNRVISVVPFLYSWDVDGIISFTIIDSVAPYHIIGDDMSVEEIIEQYNFSEIEAIIESFDRLIAYVEYQKTNYNFKSVRSCLNANMKEIEPYLT